jgi:hypothetical protein
VVNMNSDCLLNMEQCEKTPIEENQSRQCP